MRKFALILSTLTALVAAPAVANAQGFIIGMVVGGMLFGGNTQHGSGGGTILYSADEEVLKATDPMSVRQAASTACFAPNYNRRNGPGVSLGEMFAEATEKLPKKERLVLQILRVFDPSNTPCGAIWFAYTEK